MTTRPAGTVGQCVRCQRSREIVQPVWWVCAECLLILRQMGWTLPSWVDSGPDVPGGGAA